MRGFTLIELLIIIFIVGIMLSFSISGAMQLIEKCNSQIMSSQLLRAIHLARKEAIARRELVMLCKSADGLTCSGEWQDGFIILAHEKKLFTFHTPSTGILHWRAFPNHREFLLFLPRGFTAAENGTFWYCDKQALNPSWAIMINKSGRARLALPDKNNRMKDSNGKFLGC